MNQKKALITGASRGIGKAIAERFRAEGYSLLIPSHAELDLASDSSVDRYLAGLTDPIDVLVNNAGINPLGEISQVIDANIEQTMKVNLVSPLRLIRGVIPSMVKRRHGRIVNVSSVWSVVSKTGRGIYAATKAGLNALTRTLAVELAKDGILVNSISPGFVDTELTRKNNTDEQIAAICSLIPLGRLASTAEIAELVFFLCSEKNTYITGQNIIIDGGYTCL